MLRVLVIAMGMVSCHSKTVVRMPSQHAEPLVAKVTMDSDSPGPLELFVELSFGPRRSREIITAVADNVAVQACLLAAHAKDPHPIVFEIYGKIVYQGRFEGIKFVGWDGPDDCMKAAFSTIQMGRGRTGPFKLRLATGPDLIPGAKGLIISPPGPKKLE